MQKVLVGVAWPYVNGNLHVGHVAGYLLPADITARFFRELGSEVLMVSGSDCFGTPITVEADKRGITPLEVVDLYHPKNVELFNNLNLSFDLYTKTATQNHQKITQEFLVAMHEKGLLESQNEPQYFSESLGRFLPDRYVEGECPKCGYKESRSDQCDNCGTLHAQDLKNPISKIDKKPVALKNTKHIYISWPKLEEKIKKYVDSVSENWRDWVKGETYKWLNEGLKPRAITRDLDWGVEIPDEINQIYLTGTSGLSASNKRIYVWFDAVIGYYSASVEWAQINNKKWEDFWYGENISHYYFMGKDNLVFHTIFWPGQLMSFDENLHLPDFPAINQYLNLEGQKFSKSRGVIVDTAEFIEKFGSDALRFYLTTIMPEEADANFSWSDFYKKNNDLLVGHIGNYIHRTLSIYNENSFAKILSDEVFEQINLAFENSKKYLKKSQFKNYYLEIEKLAKFANLYFDEKKPWVAKKTNQEEFEKIGGDLMILTFALANLLKFITPNAFEKYSEIVSYKSNIWDNKTNLKEELNMALENIKINNPQPVFEKFEEEL